MANYRAPTNIRFPPDLHKGIKKLAEERKVSFSQIVIEACYQYLGGSVPGLCPSCHTQNDPDAQYCQKCGASLTEEAKEKQMRLEEMMRDPETLKELLKRALEHLEEIGYTKKE